MTEEIDECTYCDLCGKKLFTEKGMRLQKLCFQIGVVKKEKLDCGWNSDGSMGAVYICNECFTAENKNAMIDVLFRRIKYGKKQTL